MQLFSGGANFRLLAFFLEDDEGLIFGLSLTSVGCGNKAHYVKLVLRVSYEALHAFLRPVLKLEDASLANVCLRSGWSLKNRSVCSSLHLAAVETLLTERG